MSDDWDTVTKIGSKAGGGGGGPRQTTVKTKSQLNAAMRSGSILATEKKYGTANAASSSGSGQFLTKVDRSDDVVPQKLGDRDVGAFIAKARSDKKWNMDKLAVATNIKVNTISQIEKGTIPLSQPDCNAIEKALGIYVRGALQGQVKAGKTFKRNLKAGEDKK